MNAVEKSIARHRATARGRAWYAEHWQGPPTEFSTMVLRKMEQATRDLSAYMARMYADRQWPVAECEPRFPNGLAGLALVGAAVAPGPVGRRAFFGRLAAAVAGVAMAGLPKPEPEVWGTPIIEPLLRSNVYAEPRPLTEAMMLDFFEKVQEQRERPETWTIPVNPHFYGQLKIELAMFGDG